MSRPKVTVVMDGGPGTSAAWPDDPPDDLLDQFRRATEVEHRVGCEIQLMSWNQFNSPPFPKADGRVLMSKGDLDSTTHAGFDAAITIEAGKVNLRRYGVGAPAAAVEFPSGGDDMAGLWIALEIWLRVRFAESSNLAELTERIEVAYAAIYSLLQSLSERDVKIAGLEVEVAQLQALSEALLAELTKRKGAHRKSARGIAMASGAAIMTILGGLATIGDLPQGVSAGFDLYDRIVASAPAGATHSTTAGDDHFAKAKDAIAKCERLEAVATEE